MSLNKFFNVEVGKDLELKFGCLDMVSDDDLVINGTSTFKKIVFPDHLTVDGVVVSRIAPNVGVMTSPNIIIDGPSESKQVTISNNTTSNNVRCSIQLRVGNNLLSKDDGKVNDVLTTNADNFWTMQPFKLENTFGYAYTNDVGTEEQVPKFPSVYTSANKYGAVVSNYPNGYYSQGTNNNIRVLITGWYRIDAIVTIKDETHADVSKVNMTILLNGLRQTYAKEIKQPFSTITPTSVSFNEVLYIDIENTAIPQNIGIGYAWTGTNPAITLPFTVNNWKMNISKVN